MDKDFQLRKGQPDFMIMVISLLLLGIGLVMIYSSSQIAAYDKFNDSSFFFKRQVVWAIAGIIAMIMVMNIPYTVYKKLTPFDYTYPVYLDGSGSYRIGIYCEWSTALVGFRVY